MLETEVTVHGRVSTIQIRGRYELTSVNYVENVFREQLYADFDIIAFDLKNLHYIDSSGIGSLIRCTNLARKQNIKTVFYNLGPDIDSVFRLSKLDTLIDIISEDTFRQKYLA